MIKQEELLKGVTALRSFHLFSLGYAVDLTRLSGSAPERCNDVLFVLVGDFKARSCFLRYIWILVCRFQAAVNFGEVGFAEIRFCLFRWPEKGQASSLTEKTDVVTGIDIVSRMCHQHDGMSLVSKPAQQEHHFAVQTWIQARCWLIQEEKTGIGQQLKGN